MSERLDQHPTVQVRHGDLEADIDVEIASLILQIWRAGIRTVMSCQDSPDGWVWIEFESVDGLEKLLTLVGDREDNDDSIYARICGMSEDTEEWWQYASLPTRH